MGGARGEEKKRGGREGAGEKDGGRDCLRELNYEKQTPERGRRIICLFKGAALEYRYN